MPTARCLNAPLRPRVPAALTDSLTPDATPEPAPAAAAEPLAAEAESTAAEPELVAAEPAALSVAEPAPWLEVEPPAPVMAQVPVAEPAPLAVPASAPPEPETQPAASSASASSAQVVGLPLKLLNELLAKFGASKLQSLGDLVPVLRILSLAVLAGIALKLTSATLGAIDDLPLVGGLLELVGLVSLLNFLARNAFKQQKRAELLARIQKLKTDLLG